jgi:hypothetical protein
VRAVKDDRGSHPAGSDPSAASAAAGRLVTLSEQDCWTRLRSRDLGRIAVVVHGLPQVFPVNYGVAQGTVVFRTAPGAKLDGAHLAAVCFQVDDWDDPTATGWSVMVQGFARQVRDSADPLWAEVQGLTVHPAAPGVRTVWVAVHVDRISGRYFSGGPMAPPLAFQKQ